MDFFHRLKHDIPFMSYGKITTLISLITFIAAVVFLVTKGLNYSVEFTGGTVIEVQYAKEGADPNQVRTRLNELKMGEAQVQSLGTNKQLMIRLPNRQDMTSAQLSNNVLELLRKDHADASLRKVEFIGPQVGEELVTHGLLALGMVVVGIIIYLSVRFEWEFSLTVLAGILAVLGYSVNESVVVFDRIRENIHKPAMRGKTIPQIIDNAITATMSRTIITHGSTEAMVVSMLVFGGAALHGFAIALTIGIVFGIYSSVLVASPLLLFFGLTRENIHKPQKQKEEAVV